MQVVAEGILQQRQGHQKHGRHGVCLTFAQVQPFLQLLKIIVPLRYHIPGQSRLDCEAGLLG